MSSLLTSPILHQALADVKNPNLEVKERASVEILSQVESAQRDLPSDKFQEWYSQLVGKIAHYVVLDSSPSDKIGGIMIVEKLIPLNLEDAAGKITRFGTYLSSAIRNSSDFEALNYAVTALGHLVTPGGALVAEFVDSEVKTAIEWLGSEPRVESRRYAAVLLIRMFARNVPTLLHAFVPQILDELPTTIRDPKPHIRDTAYEAMSECFNILLARDQRYKLNWYNAAYNEAMSGFKTNSIDHLHGSLLTIKALLRSGGMYMQAHYIEACNTIFILTKHKELRIRNEVLSIVAILAAYNPNDFANNYLPKFMHFVTDQLRKEKERSAAFIALGSVASATGGRMVPYLDGIIALVKDGLRHKLRTRDKDGSPFRCISMLAIAVGQALTKHVEDGLLDSMFACGLSELLTQALVDMAHYDTPIKAQIQEKLLDLLSLVLCGRAFKPLGCPDNRLPPIPPFAREWHHNGIVHGDAEIALALHTLGSFDFKGHILNEFVRDVALDYLHNSNPEIRKAAALTCCQIYVQDPIIKQTSIHALGVVRSVVSQLLGAAVVDPVPEIRQTILHALNTKFDKHLAEQSNIRRLVMAVNETDFEVRKVSMEILGRLTNVNPAYVFPPLRKMLENFLMKIHNSKGPASEEDGARMISLITLNAPTLVRNYVDNLVDILLKKARSPVPAVAASSIDAIGDLSAVGGVVLKKYISDLMPIIIEALQDLSSLEKRDAALRALGQVASNSGYVIDPYLDHPQLLDLLTNVIKTEQQGTLRRETIKVLGILGALDPYKHQQSLEQHSESTPIEAQPVSDVSLIMQGLTPSNEEYYPQVVMHTLMNNVLKDSSLAQYHSTVIDAIVSIFKTLGLKCVSFLPQIIPTFITVIQAAPLNRIENYFNQLSILVSIVRQHIRPFTRDLVELIIQYWDVLPVVQVTTMSLMEALSRALGKDFQSSIQRLVPYMMKILDSNDIAFKNAAPTKLMQTLLVFGYHAEKSMWQVVPKLIKTSLLQERSVFIRKLCIETLGNIARQTNISELSSTVFHALMRLLRAKNKELQTAAYECILTFCFQYPADVGLFLDGVKAYLSTTNIQHQTFDTLYTRIRHGEQLPQDLRPALDLDRINDDSDFAEITQRKLPVNQEHLKNSWEASQKSTKEDWQEWMRRFSVELLKESPSNALRACASLASIYQPLAKDLFNVAFVSCWTELYDQYQEELVHALELALTSPQIPPEILQVLLNLAEFMEHDDKPLPIDIGTLGVYAGKCHAYAKALHYKELEFEEEKTSSVVEALISINNQLQQSDAAVGILRNAQKYRDFDLKETWFEKLGRWDEALDAYNEREKDEPNSFEVTMGKMRCLHALGKWETLSSLAQEKWALAELPHKKLIAPLAAAAAWGQSQWELMDNYLEAMKPTSPDRSFFGAIAALHQNSFAEATEHIERARDGLDTELSALLGESYTRAYSVVVRVQMLAELEEIITYKKNENNAEKQLAMRETWRARLLGCEGNVETWQRMLKVRALVLPYEQNIELWIKFANLCRKSGRAGLAEKTIRNLQNIPMERGDNLLTVSSGIPEVAYAQHKYTWSKGLHQKAASELREFTNSLADRCTKLASDIEKADRNVPNPMNIFHRDKPNQLNAQKMEMEKMKILLSKCFLKLGQWQTAIEGGDWTSDHYHEILLSYNSATQYNPSGYKAWHAWALANFEIVNAVASQASHETAIFPQATVTDHVIPAIQGFFRSIALSKSKSTLQDTLRLLTLWFAHGANSDVGAALVEGFPMVSMDTWLEVIPQLIARINQPNARVRQGVQKLLCDVGVVHRQALVYPLTVAMKSNVKGRADSAKTVMDQLRQHSKDLVDQAQLVSKELIRVAVLWHELWHEGFEEASKLFFGDNNVEGMFAILAPLHKLLEDGPQTLREISFQQTFGRELAEAKVWCDTYRQTGLAGDINQAWDLYHQVFKRIEKQLQQLQQLITLELKYVSPALLEAKNLELAVPGTYQSGKPVVRIQSFDKICHVISSKQRPRKMTLRGDDGQSYTFCLKGHEDIRQDERVMQLFGLVNTLLNSDADSFKRHLNIQRFPAIPLSQSSGLLGWVPNSDTFHNLVKEYREKRHILLNIEHRIMLQMAPQFENLTLMQKVEVFNYAMDNTTGKDLYRVLWLKSRSSEAWLERRTNYTRSLAVMSIVGYILGLGDRHPSNLMLDRSTGKVIHIDFGDCFEVAMHRDKYPERVPFRLTRMLTFAMEVSNIDGSYKISSEAVMRVIRENRESLMAVLEAFIHDPLLNWRLTTRESPYEPSFRSERRQSLIADTQSGGNNTTAQSAGGGPAGATSGHPHSGSFMSELEAAQTTAVGGGVLPSRSTMNSMRARGRTSALAGHFQQLQGQQQADENQREVQNARALQVLARVKEKLNGMDFKNRESLDVETQVTRLIAQATNVENICQHYIGWCSFW